MVLLAAGMHPENHHRGCGTAACHAQSHGGSWDAFLPVQCAVHLERGKTAGMVIGPCELFLLVVLRFSHSITSSASSTKNTETFIRLCESLD